MIRAFYRSSAGQVTLDLPTTDWHAALHEPHGILWVDFDAALPGEVEPRLRDTFGFHVLAIDDALRQAHVPKIDDWDDYIYAVVHSVIFNLESLAVTRQELDSFLGLNYLVTHHHQPIDAVERLWRHVDQDRRQPADTDCADETSFGGCRRGSRDAQSTLTATLYPIAAGRGISLAY